MKKLFVTLSALMAVVLMAGTAQADFTPQFSFKLDGTKAKANGNFVFHMEFDENDEEIGNFKATIPAGFNIAPDAAIEDGDEIGGGEILIHAGPDCRPGPEGQIPVKVPVTVNATFEERDRTDDEADAGVHSVWFLDLEPLNRVRLLITGNIKQGWTVEGAPTPSDNTCNPLTVDLTINGVSESGAKVITNPAKAGKYVFGAEISSQDSPSIARFKTPVKITR